MIARRCILPRRPMLHSRGFGVLNVLAAQEMSIYNHRPARKTERRFREPTKASGVQVVKPLSSAPVQMKITHLHLSAHFNVLIQNHMRAQKRMREQRQHIADSDSMPSRFEIPVLAQQRFGVLDLGRPRASLGGLKKAHQRTFADRVMHRQFSRVDPVRQDISNLASAKRPSPRHGAPWIEFTDSARPKAKWDGHGAPSPENAPVFRARAMHSPHIDTQRFAPFCLRKRVDRQITTIATRHIATLHTSENITTMSLNLPFEFVEGRTGRGGLAPQRPRLDVEAQDAQHADFAAPLGRDFRRSARSTHSDAPGPEPLNFRKEQTAPPSISAPVAPSTPAPTPQAPQIDIQQLDKVLWQRFEKRLRIETERRGRS